MIGIIALAAVAWGAVALYVDVRRNTRTPERPNGRWL